MFPKQQIDGFEKYWRRRKASSCIEYASDICTLFKWVNDQPSETIT